MKNDYQAALELFSNYSDFMLTEDELLAIHGGATNSGTASTSSTTSGGDGGGVSAPPPAPPPQAPPAPPAVSPVNVTVTYDHTPVAVEVVKGVMGSDSAGALDNLVTHAIEAVDNFFFGPDTPSAPPDAGGAGGAHGAGGSGG